MSGPHWKGRRLARFVPNYENRCCLPATSVLPDTWAAIRLLNMAVPRASSLLNYREENREGKGGGEPSHPRLCPTPLLCLFCEWPSALLGHSETEVRGSRGPLPLKKRSLDTNVIKKYIITIIIMGPSQLQLRPHFLKHFIHFIRGWENCIQVEVKGQVKPSSTLSPRVY